MKIILLHGIGNHNPGWSQELQAHAVLGVPEEDIIEFNYEDLMESNWANRLLIGAARVVASYYATPAAGFAANYVQDHLNDILTYFVVPGVRKKILARMATVLDRHPDAMVIGFSLGSVVAYEAIKNYPGVGGLPVLITIGSPLGSPALDGLVKRFLKVPDKTRPMVSGWFNLYSRLDPISGRISGLGCKQKDQFKVQATHNMRRYLEHIKDLLAEQFAA